jgi:hypothetical protein
MVLFLRPVLPIGYRPSICCLLYCVAASRRRLMSVSLQGFESIDPCVAYFIHTILMDYVSRCIDFGTLCAHGADGGDEGREIGDHRCREGKTNPFYSPFI